MPNEVVAGLLISIDGNTVKLRSELDKARTEIKETSREMKASMRDAKASIALVGDEIGVHLNRHLRGFAAQLPGIRQLMSQTWVFGAAAVAGVGVALFEAGKKATEFYEKNRAAAGEIGEAMQKMRKTTQAANDELALSNAKMAEQIAKLEHKPVNSLALALAEARVEADQLSASIEKSVEEVGKLFKEKGISGIGALITGQESTTDAAKTVQKHLDAIEAVDEEEQQRLADAKPGDDLDKIRSDAQVARLKAIRAAVDETKEAWNRLNKEREADKTLEAKEGLGPIQGHDPERNIANLTIYGEAAHQFQALLNTVSLMGESSNLKTHLSADQAAHDASERAKAAQEEARKAAQDLLKSFETSFRQQKTMHGMSNQEEVNFWQSKLGSFKVGTSEYLTVLDKYSAALQQRYRAEDAADKETEEAIKRAFHLRAEAQKEQERQAEVRTGRAEAAGLTPWIRSENAAELNLVIAREAERTGQVSRGTAAYVEQENVVARLARELQTVQEKQDRIAKAGAARWTAESNPETAENAVLAAKGKLTAARLQLGYLQQQLTFRAQMSKMFDDWIQRATDAREIATKMWGDIHQSIDSLNGEMAKAITGQKTNFKRVFENAGESFTKTGLETAEGFGMKLLGFGGGHHKANGYNVHVDNLPDKPGAGSIASAGGKGLLGMLNNSNWASSLFGGKLFGAGGFFGARASGGMIEPNVPYLVGEYGPELRTFEAGGYIHNAATTARTLSQPNSGSSSAPEIHYHIDARGTDPALVAAHTAAAMRATHARAVSDATRAMAEHQRRTPQR